jgi:hypothetical protein
MIFRGRGAPRIETRGDNSPAIIADGNVTFNGVTINLTADEVQKFVNMANEGDGSAAVSELRSQFYVPEAFARQLLDNLRQGLGNGASPAAGASLR